MIRSYLASDWPAICRIHDAARLGELRDTLGVEAFEPLAEIAQEEGLLDGELWVAEEDGRVVGFAAAEAGRIDWLYVHPEFQRRGIGRSLLRAALAYCGPKAEVTQIAGNTAALRLYQSEGLKIVEERSGSMRGFAASFIRLGFIA